MDVPVVKCGSSVCEASLQAFLLERVWLEELTALRASDHGLDSPD